ncbi:hypothetical protein D3C84_840810 [compost metagenome]
MHTADVVIACQGGRQPSLLEQGLKRGGQLGSTAYRAGLTVKPAQQRLPDGIHVPPVPAGKHRQVTFPLLQQFQQPVLRRDVGMGTGLTQ